VGLFIPEKNSRIDVHCTAGRDGCCQKTQENHCERDCKEQERVGGAGLIDDARQELACSDAKQESRAGSLAEEPAYLLRRPLLEALGSSWV
jgi:hypothetical protein